MEDRYRFSIALWPDLRTPFKDNMIIYQDSGFLLTENKTKQKREKYKTIIMKYIL